MIYRKPRRRFWPQVSSPLDGLGAFGELPDKGLSARPRLGELSLAMLFLLAPRPPSVAGDLPKLYLELVEPDVSIERRFCETPLRLKVLVAHEQDGLTGGIFGLSVRDAEGNVIVLAGLELIVDPIWSVQFLTIADGHVITGLIPDGSFEGPPRPGSPATPLADLTVRLPTGFEGEFQVVFDNPLVQGGDVFPPVLVFFGTTSDVELCPSRVYESVPPPFLRGDANLDQAVDVSDALAVLNGLFLGQPLTCLDAADANDDGAVDISDPLYALNFLFDGGPPIPAPYPAAGIDTTADELGCEPNCPPGTVSASGRH